MLSNTNMYGGTITQTKIIITSLIKSIARQPETASPYYYTYFFTGFKPDLAASYSCLTTRYKPPTRPIISQHLGPNHSIHLQYTCFDSILRCLHGGIKGLSTGYKGRHFPKWVINYYGGTKGLTTGYKGQGGPKLKNGLKLKNGQLTLVGPLFGGVLFCAPHSFFGPGGIAHGRSQVHVKVPKTGQDME